LCLNKNKNKLVKKVEEEWVWVVEKLMMQPMMQIKINKQRRKRKIQIKEFQK
jgi:hypothetical protein